MVEGKVRGKGAGRQVFGKLQGADGNGHWSGGKGQRVTQRAEGKVIGKLQGQDRHGTGQQAGTWAGRKWGSREQGAKEAGQGAYGRGHGQGAEGGDGEHWKEVKAQMARNSGRTQGISQMAGWRGKVRLHRAQGGVQRENSRGERTAAKWRRK